MRSHWRCSAPKAAGRAVGGRTRRPVSNGGGSRPVPVGCASGQDQPEAPPFRQAELAAEDLNLPERLGVRAVLDAFHHGGQRRARVHMTGGSGKTSLGLWVAEHLKTAADTRVQTVLVLVPTVNLVAQPLEEWAARTRWAPGEWRALCVCHDEEVGTEDVAVTTDPAEVKEFLGGVGLGAPVHVVFSTYKSAARIGEAQGMLLSAAGREVAAPGESESVGSHFDLAVFDEAHHTATRVECFAANALSDELRDEGVRIHRRLFMSAIRRVPEEGNARNSDGDLVFASMEDTELYGELVYNLTFTEAVALQICKPFKLVYAVLSDEVEMRGWQLGNVAVAGADGKGEVDGEGAAKVYAVRKMAQGHGARGVLTFHNRTRAAELFCADAVRLLPDAAEREVLWVHGAPLMGHRERAEALQQSSQAAIQQAVMRATRTDGELEHGLVGVVASVGEGGGRALAPVLQALMDMDEQLEHRVRELREAFSGGRGEYEAALDQFVREYLPAGMVERAVLVKAVEEKWDEKCAHQLVE
ncbi:hypothetical protein CYMTET_33483 [Cymbomonas tetramitiformis]|uniref:Helicase/UvrB N-terminal domain-containing protein n=1 Tax=Cymbomonas tetramitiformis TaxID=36881 RepID=A0AAE0FD31_9CHLO|nr:hypothetical protein CYMTET_33483 [Cymbomonas tetramitiformis]